MPDPLDLDAIEYRANAATPGPWEWTRPEFSPSSDCHVLLSSATTTSYGHTARIEVHSDGSAYGEYNPDIDVNGPDAALIANARTDIPALVARVRQLEAERDERERQHAARGAEAVAVIDALRVELANERGEGEGPSEGWEWASYPGRWGNPNGWSLIERGLSHAAVGRNADGTGWDWYAMVPSALRGGVSGSAPTAREAMRQADLARGAK